MKLPGWVNAAPFGWSLSATLQMLGFLELFCPRRGCNKRTESIAGGSGAPVEDGCEGESGE